MSNKNYKLFFLIYFSVFCGLTQPYAHILPSYLKRLEEAASSSFVTNGVKGEHLRKLLYDVISALEHEHPSHEPRKRLKEAFLKNTEGFSVFTEVLAYPEKTADYLGFSIPPEKVEGLFPDKDSYQAYQKMAGFAGFAEGGGLPAGLYQRFFEEYFFDCCSLALKNNLNEKINGLNFAHHFPLDNFFDQFDLGAFEAKRGLMKTYFALYYSDLMPLRMKYQVIKGFLSIPISDAQLASKKELEEKRAAAVIVPVHRVG